MRRELDKIKNEIECISGALALAPEGHPNLLLSLICLGASHEKRFRLLGELYDLDMAIDYESRAVALTSTKHPDLPNRLANLAASHNDRFERLGELDDLEKAIKYQTRSLEVAPDSRADLSHLLTNLSLFRRARFRLLGELNDLSMAIEYGSCALVFALNGHPDLPSLLANLGVNHNDRYEYLGELNDLKKAIEYQSRAVASTPNGHPDLPERLAYLGVFYESQFLQIGQLDDLEKAIEYESRALNMTFNGHPTLRYQLANLGGSYYIRFRHLGKLNDLEKAIEFQSRALAVTPEGHMDLPRQLAILGASHGDRFGRLGWLGDLKLAIEYKTRSLALTSNDHPEFSSQLANLGVSHGDRFKRLGDLDDIKKAIAYQSQALAMIPKSHPDLPNLLANLGALYTSQYQRLKELSDLDKAIEYSSLAIALAPEGCQNLSHQLANLGASYSIRFQRLGNPEDFAKVVEYQSLALAVPPDDHAFSSHKIMNLRASYSSRFEHSKLNANTPNSGSATMDSMSRATYEPPVPTTALRKGPNEPEPMTPFATSAHNSTPPVRHSKQLKDHLTDEIKLNLNPSTKTILSTSTNTDRPCLVYQQVQASAESVTKSDTTSRLDIELQIDLIDSIQASKLTAAHNGEKYVPCDTPIGVSTTVCEVISRLVEHGCPNLANDVDHSTFSEHPISNGGFSDIYQGCLRNKTKVAIKALRISANALTAKPKHLKHAARELHTWSKCTHPNVLQLHGLVEFRDRIGMVSPWMEKGNLPRYLQQTPGVDRCNLCIQICDGLSFMHQIGIIHGDLKGANVLISDDGVPVLADFGSAFYPNQTLRFTQTTSGSSLTVGWAAPELLSDSDAPSEASDVYALGMFRVADEDSHSERFVFHSDLVGNVRLISKYEVIVYENQLDEYLRGGPADSISVIQLICDQRQQLQPPS
ncbi:unnamed protein product [Rhizoctonia solani]|uniref:Protein kinase domain-containing protein n=1 Tax=Rhizoctonia solani TaxID=456999 RepID=A0A8H3A1A0_9AGAM|nr:unnamed protein product [Rhizoctonia solani]